MVVAGLLVREVGVGHPQVLQVLRADIERDQAFLCFEGQPWILPKLTKKEVACEILKKKVVLHSDMLL